MRILIVDEQAMFRQGLRTLLQALRPQAQCLECARPEQAAAAPAPELLLVRPARRGAPAEDPFAGLRQRFPQALLVALADLPDAAQERAARAAGADEFLAAELDPVGSMRALERLLLRTEQRRTTGPGTGAARL